LRIQIYSDIHLERAPFAPPESDADVVVLAGDIANGAAGVEWAKEIFDAPVLYLAGNHEYYEGEFESVSSAMRAFSAAPCGPTTRSCPRASAPR
jgi:3',5'-cyclic AMP phosphodiesterase CpdA